MRRSSGTNRNHAEKAVHSGARFMGSAWLIALNHSVPLAACSISLITACGCET
jgi:hypothetical protein